MQRATRPFLWGNEIRQTGLTHSFKSFTDELNPTRRGGKVACAEWPTIFWVWHPYMVLSSQFIEINVHQDVAQNREIVIEQLWLGKTHRRGEPTEKLWV